MMQDLQPYLDLRAGRACNSVLNCSQWEEQTSAPRYPFCAVL